MARKQKLKKGEYGYIDFKRRTQPLMVLFYILIGLGIFGLGLLLNKFEKANLFTIISFRTIPLQLKQKVDTMKQKEDTIFYDAVFTSPEKIMFLSVICVAGNEVIGLLGRKKDSLDIIEKYLKESIKKRGWAYKITIVSQEKEFFKKLQSADRKLIREEKEELLDYLTSLLVE